MPVMRAPVRPLGVVYTPPDVARAMVQHVLAPLTRDKGAAELLALRVCDPAIGEGAFLVEVVATLAAQLVAAWGAEADARPRRGADGDARDRSAQPPADRATWQAAARKLVTQRCITGVDVDRRAVAAARDKLGATGEALGVADALALDWPARFPEVFARGGFDLIVANPPYIRQERLTRKAEFEAFASYHGTADLYVYFVELAHRLLRAGGRYCLIIPNKWLTVAYGRGLRGFLAAQQSVEGVVDLSRAPVFADADAFPCVVWGTKGRALTGPIRAARPEARTPVARALADAPADHPRERWQAEPWHVDAPAERALLDRLERSGEPLGELVPGRPSRGVVTGCNRAFVINRETRARLLDREPAADAIIRPFVKGRDVRRWQAAMVERWILLVERGSSLDQLPAVRAHLEQYRAALEPRPAAWPGAWAGRKPGTYAWYALQDPVVPLASARTPRLFYQDIQTEPACSLDPEGELVPDTTVWILPTADPYVLAVLNSPLYGWYARRRFPPALNRAVRPKLEYMRRMPIARPDPATHREVSALVARRLALEPSRRAGDQEAVHLARGLDDELANAVSETHRLSRSERALIDAR